MRIGIDLGGTKIEVLVLDDAGEERYRDRIPTPSHDYEATIDAIASLIQAAEAATGSVCSIGLGTPGTISPHTGLMKNCNSTCLNGRPLDQDLESALGRQVRMANDANCFALSEATDGAGRGAHVVFGVILGTGCGGGLVVGQEVLRGPNAIAGEWGHAPLPWPRDHERPGPACYCGQSGCLETFLSGPGLSAAYFEITEDRVPAHEIVERAADGEHDAARVLAAYEDRLARGLAMVINVVDPDVVVLGGGLSNIERLYRNVPEIWTRHVFSDHVATRLVPAMHGDSSGVRGAAWLWPPA